MSSSNTGAGGVKNLRAMFENKANDQSTSPPSRGRSPNGSTTSSHSRPVSKVRTSFVSVEKVGDAGGPLLWGLRKTTDMTMDGTTENAITNDDGQVLAAQESGLGVILKGSPFESVDAPQAEKKSGGRSQSVSDKKQEELTKPALATNGIADRAASMVKKMQQPESKKPPPVTKLQTTNNAQPIKPPPTRLASTKLASPTDTKKSPITPTGAGPIGKPRGGAAKIQAVMNSATQAKEARQTANTSNEAPAATKDKSTHAQKESVAVQKPSTAAKSVAQPRSPARASRLSTAATAPTAASVAKADTVHADSKPAERKIVARGPPRAANTTTASALAKKTSRVSLNTNERPKSRVSTAKPATEGFLARMTRPTASSAQKVQKAHEKAQPPNHPLQDRRTSAGRKDILRKSSRKSLTGTNASSDENKENEGNVDGADVPPVPEIPVGDKESTEKDITANGSAQLSQQAEVETSH